MIRYDLQFFAKDGPGGEKTEPASQKKLDDARKKGQVAKSRDLTGSITLFAFFLILKFYTAIMGKKFAEGFQSYYTRIPDLGTNGQESIDIGHYMINVLRISLQDILLILLPIFAIGFVIAFVSDLVQVRWKVSTDPIKPKGSKFSPASGIKKIFSIRTLVNVLKQIAIVAVCLIVAYNKIKNDIGIIFSLYDVTLNQAIAAMGDIIINLGINISIIYLVIGAADYIFEKFKFKQDMKMTKQEVKDEWKDTEGSPDVKSAQKRRMQEASRRRMMQAVPEADVVITNPTHLAVALSYEPDSGKAPVVVAKGADYVAMKIKEIARESNVEIVENKPLARMLYYNVEIDQQIPQELYQAVAEVLAFVWKLHNKI